MVSVDGDDTHEAKLVIIRCTVFERGIWFVRVKEKGFPKQLS